MVSARQAVRTLSYYSDRIVNDDSAKHVLHQRKVRTIGPERTEPDLLVDVRDRGVRGRR